MNKHRQSNLVLVSEDTFRMEVLIWSKTQVSLQQALAGKPDSYILQDRECVMVLR